MSEHNGDCGARDQVQKTEQSFPPGRPAGRKPPDKQKEAAQQRPKTATIQYFAAPSSERPGPNRAASISRASRNPGQALSGRNCLREPSGVLGRFGAFSSVVRSFMRRFSVECSRADKLATAREFASINGAPELAVPVVPLQEPLQAIVASSNVYVPASILLA